MVLSATAEVLWIAPGTSTIGADELVLFSHFIGMCDCRYLAPFLFFPLCMVGIYLLAGLMIAGFQEEFMQRFMDKVLAVGSHSVLARLPFRPCSS